MSPRRRWRPALLVGLALALVAALLGLHLLSHELIEPGAAPPAAPATGFDHADLALALERHVSPEGVDYEALVAEPEPVRRYAAALAGLGPRTAPERFPTQDHRLAYWINAYNALVLLGVVSHWPIESVQDVRRFVEPAGGFTFFYGLHFRLDGGTTSLADLENDLIRAQGDARIHAAINCASRSCPSLQARPFEAATLNEQLEEVTRAFCNDTRHVRLDSEARTVQLSRIFDWFGSDFEQHAQRLDRPPDVLAFVEAFAEPELELQLGRARQEGWEREFVDYDWSLNRSR